MIQGFLKKDITEGWQIEGIDLLSGDQVELLIGGQWICGSIEYWNGECYWFSSGDGVPVQLDFSIKARINEVAA